MPPASLLESRLKGNRQVGYAGRLWDGSMSGQRPAKSCSGPYECKSLGEVCGVQVPSLISYWDKPV